MKLFTERKTEEPFSKYESVFSDLHVCSVGQSCLIPLQPLDYSLRGSSLAIEISR